MPRNTSNERKQIGVRLSPDAVELLAKLQAHYTKRAGLVLPISQSETVEIVLREAAERAKIK